MPEQPPDFAFVEFPDTIPVAVTPADGTIVDVGPYRHAVRWTADRHRVSSITYCNNCGGTFTRGGRLRPDAQHPDDAREFHVCADCGIFQGFR